MGSVPRYYGWVVLALGAVAMVGTLPGRTQGLGLITAPLLEDLRLPQLRFASLNLVATLVGASFALPAGWLVDRFGIRVAVPLFEALLGVVVIALAGVHAIFPFAILLTLTRGLGQTALSIGSLATVGKWFARRLSLAMGVYAFVLGCGFIAAFPGVQAAVKHYGWRHAFGGVGWALLAIALLSALFLRRAPAANEPEIQRETATDTRSSVTLQAALRTPAFWVWGITCALYLLVASGTGLFTELMLRERGLGSDVFRGALATTALVGMLANFGGGLLGARWSIQKLLALSTLLLVPCLHAYPHITTATDAIAWSAGLGLAGGVVTVVFFTLWAEHFGPEHLGKIQGVAQALTVVASALGPIVFAAAKDQTGKYDRAFLGLAPVFVIAAAASWIVPAPRRA